MSTAVILMAIIALLCLVGGGALGFKRTASQAAVYRNRIAATMLGAAGIVLFGYALTLRAWDAS